ncbi:Ribosomal_L21p domain-containing protein [Cephalotus follicularis]|uniref:Ribosomal_L21p domain-containing protein n=1 Tax=Cephalotus follicularis TaxID=3775 RepID=A0A1Q3BDE0_CEPFO|nr:Ribosomal_L21p domain-containing protein [Cephalotus follicularis]
MATSTISLCSSLTTHCKISYHHPNRLSSSLLPLSKIYLSLSRPKASPPFLSTRPAFSHITRFSESEAAVVDTEPDKGEPAQIVEIGPKEEPKREEVFAVVMIGGRQYIVFPGRWIYTQRLKGANVNDKIVLNKVLLVGTKTSTYIGKPVVTNAAVHAVVEEQGLNPKVIVFKYKKKKNYRRNIGHRQPNTRIRITAIAGYQDYPAVTLDS